MIDSPHAYIWLAGDSRLCLPKLFGKITSVLMIHENTGKEKKNL